MNYYKLISGQNIVGIASPLDFRMFQQKHRVLLACSDDTAQYVQCGDKLYRDTWMLPTTTNTIPYETVSVEIIEKSEYDALAAALETQEQIAVEQPEEPVVYEPSEDSGEDVTVEFVRNGKIAEMSAICKQTIYGGIEVELSDGNSYHFALTLEDQINITSLEEMAKDGVAQIPYHADGELCKFYSVADIITIVEAAKSFKSYHVTYFNALKAYIKSLESIEDITAVQYGMSIPAAYQSDVLRYLISLSANAATPEE